MINNLNHFPAQLGCNSLPIGRNGSQFKAAWLALTGATALGLDAKIEIIGAIGYAHTISDGAATRLQNADDSIDAQWTPGRATRAVSGINPQDGFTLTICGLIRQFDDLLAECFPLLSKPEAGKPIKRAGVNFNARLRLNSQPRTWRTI